MVRVAGAVLTMPSLDCHHPSSHAPSLPAIQPLRLAHDIADREVNKNEMEADSPLSLVHSSCRLISASVTVGRTFSKLFRKSANFSGGSCSSSDSISFHDFSTASESPGEQGVHFIFVDDGDDPGGGVDARTGLKCVAETILRTGCIRASRTAMEISEPV